MDSTVSENLKPGTVLNTRYRIESVLGQGGMGAVYLARIDTLNKPVAIKEMRVQASDDRKQQQAIDQFRQEAHFLANLDHPNLVQVSDFFVEDNRYYLVMAYVKGKNLSERMNAKAGHLPVAQVLDWAIQLTSVLGYLHSQNPPILFRDLKPSNIMLDESGTIRLIDFGIARNFIPDVATVTFLQGMGSAGYSPLEQYQGAGGTDPRSDIYALGATIYHLLTNKVPPSPVELVATGEAAPSSQKLNPSIPGALDKVIQKMMGLRKDDRYQSMQQVRQLLEQISRSLQSADDSTENLAVSLSSMMPPAPSPPPARAPVVAPNNGGSGKIPPMPSNGTGGLRPAQTVVVTQPDSGGAALWLTAGALCMAALGLFGWMFLQAQPPGARASATPSPVATVQVQPTPAQVAQQKPPRPAKPARKPKPEPRVAERRPVPPPRPKVAPARPKPEEPEVPSLGSGGYPTSSYPTRQQPAQPAPQPVAVQPTIIVAQPPAPAPAPEPIGAPPGGFPGPPLQIASGTPGWWGNHPGYTRAIGPGWVQDDRGSWHPPPGAPNPPEGEPTSKVGGTRVK